MPIIIPEKVNPLQLSYPDFSLGSIINPDEFDQNNLDIMDKLNEFIDTINVTIDNTVEVETIVNGANTKSDTAIATANSAVTSANNAVTTANTASINASNAVTTANNASIVATNAINKATQVETDYNALESTLLQAVQNVEDAVASISGKADISYVNAQISNTVSKTSDEIIGGNKEFAMQPIVPYPTANTHASTKKYVDDVAQGLVLTGVADGSVTDIKLGNGVDDIKNRFTVFSNNTITAFEDVTSELSNKSNVGHTHLKSEVGLSNVDNTSDANKPVSTAQQTALNLKANLASPTFTGTPLSTTPSTTDNSTNIATTAYVRAQQIKGSTTVTNASWVASGNVDYPYKKSVAITGVVAGDYPDVRFTLATLPIAEASGMKYVECYAGGITLYGKVPTPPGSVTFDYIIDKA